MVGDDRTTLQEMRVDIDRMDERLQEAERNLADILARLELTRDRLGIDAEIEQPQPGNLKSP
jgi:hypothetical protein